jgi:hypothetical protein
MAESLVCKHCFRGALDLSTQLQLALSEADLTDSQSRENRLR